MLVVRIDLRGFQIDICRKRAERGVDGLLGEGAGMVGNWDYRRKPSLTNKALKRY